MGFHETFLESEKDPKQKQNRTVALLLSQRWLTIQARMSGVIFHSLGSMLIRQKCPGKYKDKKLARSISRKLSVTGDVRKYTGEREFRRRYWRRIDPFRRRLPRANSLCGYMQQQSRLTLLFFERLPTLAGDAFTGKTRSIISF